MNLSETMQLSPFRKLIQLMTSHWKSTEGNSDMNDLINIVILVLINILDTNYREASRAPQGFIKVSSLMAQIISNFLEVKQNSTLTSGWFQPQTDL